jgi:3-dehydroquinate synthase
MFPQTSESKIIFTNTIAGDFRAFLEQGSYSSACILVDENTWKHCLPKLDIASQHIPVIKIKSGEIHKTLETCSYIWRELTALQLDRKALLVNLGGGVIGDMGGFCAATYKRGIDFIQIPTTLLSQVDASVGGKLGIDFMDLKNHIGVFKDPKAVLITTDFLETLKKEELRSGFAEVLKHCLIQDKSKWEEIKDAPFDTLDWQDLVRHSVSIKSRITNEDPLETGLRKILNFGHTVGHAIESYFLNIPGKRLLHGEAIAAGMVCESYIAAQKKFITAEELNEISSCILNIYGKVEIFDFDLEKILPLTLQDKKNDNKVIQCSLLEKVGKGNYNIPVSLKDIRESILYYNLHHAGSEKKFITNT